MALEVYGPGREKTFYFQMYNVKMIGILQTFVVNGLIVVSIM